MFSKILKPALARKTVEVIVFDQSGHTATESRLGDLKEEELMKPGRAILVNGVPCRDWAQVIDQCVKTPSEDPIQVASILQIQGG